MKLFNSIFKRKETDKLKKFWKRPDRYFVYIRLGQNGESVTGMLKENRALIKRIPQPESGFYYGDEVFVKGPVGTRFFKDEEIDEYEVIRLKERTKIQTFTFEGIVTNSKDYFNLQEAFHEIGQAVEFPFPRDENRYNWNSGLCVGQNEKQVRKLFTNYVRWNPNRKIRNVKLWNETK